MEDPITSFEAIAERVLTCEADPAKQVTVKLGAPRLGATADYYLCPFSIEGPDVHVVRYAAGLDAFQALRLAHVAIGAHLFCVEREWGGSLRWLDSDSGFPRP